MRIAPIPSAVLVATACLGCPSHPAPAAVGGGPTAVAEPRASGALSTPAASAAPEVRAAGGASTASAQTGSPSTASVAPSGVEPRSSAPRSCRCDVIGFESDGPPMGTCTWVARPDGAVDLTGTTSSPKLTAVLRPVAPGPRRAVDYAYEGVFDFACTRPWCGRQELRVLRVGDLDYRVTVARSPDGPPSDVLWITCER